MNMGAYTHVCPRLETCMRNEDREVIAMFPCVVRQCICFQGHCVDWRGLCSDMAFLHKLRDAGL